MKTLSRFIVFFVVICLVGCAGSQRGMMAGPRMKLKAYKKLNVGLLPVSVNPAYLSEDLPLDLIQKAVHDELEGKVHIDALTLAPKDVGFETSFPLTPNRLVAAGSRLNQSGVVGAGGKVQKMDALMGVNILAWSPPTGSHRARISLVITFADLKDTTKKWVLSSTWKSDTVEQLPHVLSTELGTEFNKLNRFLKSGVIPFTGEHGSPEEPILTFFSPTKDTPQEERVTLDKSVNLVVTAIDDDGLESLQVRNETTGYTWQPAATSGAELPIFLSSPLTMPLAYGSNDISVIALDKNQQQTHRKISYKSTSRRGVHLLAIGVQSYAGVPDAKGATQAVATLADKGASKFVGSPDVLLDSDARSRRVREAVSGLSTSLGTGDELLAVLVGRGGVTRDDPYLTLFGTEYSTAAQAGSSGEGVARTLHLSDLAPLAYGRPALIVMDLCTDAQYLEEAQLALAYALNKLQRAEPERRLQLAAQISDCRRKDFGRVAATAADWLAKSRKRAEAGVEPLAAALGEQFGLLAVAKAPPASPFKFSPEGFLRFWAVASSSPNKETALTESKRLKAQGFTDSEVVLGINGVFSATLGSVDSAEKAKQLIRSAQQQGKIGDLGYILDGEKVKLQVAE